jgi:hypothetical protein
MENRRKPAPPAATLDINCDCKEAIVANYLDPRLSDPAHGGILSMSSAMSARARCGDEAGNPVHNPQAEAAREPVDRACLRHAADPDRP